IFQASLSIRSGYLKLLCVLRGPFPGSHKQVEISGRRTKIAKQSHICLAISGRRLQAHGDRKAESHLSCDLRPETGKSARRLQSRVTFVLRSPAGDCKRTEIAKPSHIFVLRSPAGDCKRTEIAKPSHICLAISGRRLQGARRLQSLTPALCARHRRMGWNRLEKRLTLTEQRQNSGEGGGGGNSSSSKEATSQAVSARPSLTQSIDPNRIPDEPWLENNWEINPEAYENLCRLYSDYFHRIHGGSNDRYISIKEFIRLMFFLSYASKEQLEETVFRIVSDGEDRVSVGQLIQMHCFRMQRPMSCHLINLISECDRSGSGLLDVYDFRLLIAKLQQMEQLECTQAQPPMEREREKMDEALLEANDLQSWSWDIAVPHLRMSSQLRSLAHCRSLLEQHPALGEALSRLAWESSSSDDDRDDMHDAGEGPSMERIFLKSSSKKCAANFSSSFTTGGSAFFAALPFFRLSRILFSLSFSVFSLICWSSSIRMVARACDISSCTSTHCSLSSFRIRQVDSGVCGTAVYICGRRL
uniref:EF-hand domain-containing protein n=1 Tax=Macrostomum lignano TaxID=282301 RepID=A0A1I8IX86_9PLAT